MTDLRYYVGSIPTPPVAIQEWKERNKLRDEVFLIRDRFKERIIELSGKVTEEKPDQFR